MRIPTWRIALTGAAIVILGVAGIGFVSASNSAPPASSGGGSAAADELALDAALAAARGSDARGTDAGALGRGRWFLRHVVHAVVTVEGREGDLVTIQLDRGSVTAVDADSLTLSEKGGGSVTVTLNDETKVREGRERSTLDAIDVGDNLFVQSRVDGSTLAKRILIVPAS
jgi:hypothetical protein